MGAAARAGAWSAAAMRATDIRARRAAAAPALVWLGIGVQMYSKSGCC